MPRPKSERCVPEATVEDGARFDQAIIDALISEERTLLHALNRQGISNAAAWMRAGELGLTHEFVRRCRLSGSRPSMRVCMKCDAQFLSAGMHNRLCRRCHAYS